MSSSQELAAGIRGTITFIKNGDVVDECPARADVVVATIMHNFMCGAPIFITPSRNVPSGELDAIESRLRGHNHVVTHGWVNGRTEMYINWTQRLFDL